MPYQAAAHAGLVALLERRSGWATIWGDNGSGKSHLICGAIADAVRVGLVAKYYHAADVQNEFSASMSEDGSSPAHVVDRLAAVPVLAIDELPKYHWESDWFRVQMQTLLDRRYRSACAGLTITLFGSETEPGQPVKRERNGHQYTLDWCPSDILSRMRDVLIGVDGAPAFWEVSGVDMRSIPR